MKSWLHGDTSAMGPNEYRPQVSKSHYFPNEYSSERRFISYYHQVKHVLALASAHQGRNVLVVGKGDGVVPRVLEAYSDLLGLNLSVQTFDFAADLQPTYLGDLREIDLIVSRSFDITVCCQVLEHLTLDDALMILATMQGMTRFLILSIPYKTITIRGSLKVPVLPELVFCAKVPVLRSCGEMVDARHYWELGASISVRKFKRELESRGFRLLDSYTLKKHGNIYFTILESQGQSR